MTRELRLSGVRAGKKGRSSHPARGCSKDMTGILFPHAQESWYRGEGCPSPMPSSLVGSKPGAVCGDLSGHSTCRPHGHSQASSDAPALCTEEVFEPGMVGRRSGHVCSFAFCNPSFKTSIRKLALVAQACHLSIPEVEAGGLQR